MNTPATRLPSTALAMLVLTLFVASGCTAACYPSLGGSSSSTPAQPDKSSTFSPAAAAGGY